MSDDNSKTIKSTTSKAKERVEQISSHVSAPSPGLGGPKDEVHSQKANTSTRRRRKKSVEAGPPADYSDILSQISTLRTLASTPEPSRSGYARQKQAGKLWVRERVEQMFDQGTVQEIGSISGTVTWRRPGPGSDAQGDGDGISGEEEPESFVPSNNVQGFALVGGRKVCFTADDYSLRAGHADGALWEKTVSRISPRRDLGTRRHRADYDAGIHRKALPPPAPTDREAGGWVFRRRLGDHDPNDGLLLCTASQFVRRYRRTTECRYTEPGGGLGTGHWLGRGPRSVMPLLRDAGRHRRSL